MKVDVRQYLTGTLPLALVLLALTAMPASATSRGRTSKPITAVLRQPLPLEEISLSKGSREWTVTGPTFVYRVQRATGVIRAMRVERLGQNIIVGSNPADILLDNLSMDSELANAQLTVVEAGTDKIILRAQGLLRRPDRGQEVDYTLTHTFFNDGVVVSEVKLKPRKDLLIEKALTYELGAEGRFSHYLHKRRDEHGGDAVRGALPGPGKEVSFATLTSCLQVFSPAAALAVFTDSGARHLSRPGLGTAAVRVKDSRRDLTQASLTQYVIRVAPGDPPFRLKAQEEFTFRVGISVAPNRLPHPRMHDLRMFAWVGDARYPYPTDDEITTVAQAGYTLFQMHRLGTPGEPRPPAGQLERVINKVHGTGMLFLWTANADLMYARAPRVRDLMDKGQWKLWQGFNYGGRYTASMDPYCDLIATCLASPNGLAEYRLDCMRRMMDRFSVDGMYIDDNLAYPGCSLWREHGHPSEIYDCLIELHEMNWRRRQLLRSRCPHQVLVSHNTRGIILPAVCDFDAHLYGEGYSFGSLENYWDYYISVQAMPAQGMIWPGGQDPVRCEAAVAYNYDLLTGGGQYCQIDWRLFPKKFSHAVGVTEADRLYVQASNLAQYYFGLYESKAWYFADSPDIFATTTPQTYATIYRNQVWGEWLIPVANMRADIQTTSLRIRSPKTLGIQPKASYVLFDVHRRVPRVLKGEQLNAALSDLSIAGESLRLFNMRPVPLRSPYHIWGGKRIAENWNQKKRKMTLRVLGPMGLHDTLIFGTGLYGVSQVHVAETQTPFFFDPVRNLVHGSVVFTSGPLEIEVSCSPDRSSALEEKPTPTAQLP